VNVGEVRDLASRLRTEIAKGIVGQDETVTLLLIALMAGGHILLEGPPGTAKTFLGQCFARAVDLQFGRIQFTPDLMPGDIIGANLFNFQSSSFSLIRGPIFCELLLADEINRTPPKTQAALLESMQEGSVTIDGTSHPLPSPFVVIATLNPIEYEGTYALPEAQLDRFVMQVRVGYPSPADEEGLLRLRHTGVRPSTLDDVVAVTSAAELLEARDVVDATVVSDEVITYTSAIVRRTREMPAVLLGASPRAGVHLLAVAKAWACFNGRDYVVPDDVAQLASVVLEHRLILTPEAELDRFTSQQVIANVLASVTVPR
jgi:MoxR-like ATPase